MEAASMVEAETMDSDKGELVVAPGAQPEMPLSAENSDALPSESSPAPVGTEATTKAKPAAKTYDSLDAVLKAMSDHEEQLKGMKTQIQEMLSNSAVLRKSIKQLVQDAQKGNAAEVELAQARRKLSTLKNFLATA